MSQKKTKIPAYPGILIFLTCSTFCVSPTGTFTNNFLNENSQEVFAEVKPQIGAQLGEMISLLANNALSSLSTSQFDQLPFPPEQAAVPDEKEQLSTLHDHSS